MHKAKNAFLFGIRLLDDNRLIGYIELEGILWTHQTGWIGIGIGEPDYWNRGYGREAMALALDFSFGELNLHRTQLTVFDYNQRAIALYEKLGFQHEGTFREFLHRDGRRYDMHLYGLLRREWQERPV
jgi:RimJ/RimL family protein N-acetyltransferase